jgi:5-methylcytosine-specific restriction endonuclease McrA
MYLHIIPRAIAKERGFKRFYTGSPCKYGHLAERVTSSSTCLICDAERKRVFRKENPEADKSIQKNSRKKHADQRRIDNKNWRKNNPEKVRELRRTYAKNNPEKVAAGKLRHYEKHKERMLANSKKRRLDNIEHYKALNKAWRENNRQAVRTLNRNRKLRLKMVEGKHSASDVSNILKLQKNKCAACTVVISGKDYHVDHIQPIALGGSNWPSNLQILCPTCNMSKGAKKPEDFYAGLGYLL